MAKVWCRHSLAPNAGDKQPGQAWLQAMLLHQEPFPGQTVVTAGDTCSSGHPVPSRKQSRHGARRGESMERRVKIPVDVWRAASQPDIRCRVCVW